jgi:sulfate permease, SulP family
MAYMILAHIGDDDPEVVMATVITSYAVSSILTGFVFLLLGALRLGDLVSFFPRSILLGCIGGVGVFLILTGIEVSAGLDSSIGWGLETFERLLYPSTLPLWAIPLLLSMTLMVIRKYIQHPVVMPAFFVAIVGIFYLVITALPSVDLHKLRKSGWVFDAPEAGAPFYNFYTYYSKSTAQHTSANELRFQESELGSLVPNRSHNVCIVILWHHSRSHQCSGFGHCCAAR